MADDPLARLAPIASGPETLADLAAAERREWWLGNGRGAYAGGTAALSLTRRYHGLLIAPIDPPLGRVLVLAKADATATIDGVSYPLFANRWHGGVIEPAGHRQLAEFRLDGTVPVWRFRCGAATVEHRIWLEPGADRVYLGWKLEGAAAAWLGVTFLANGRDHHGDTWQPGFNPEIAASGATLTVTVPGRFALRIAGSGGHIEPRGGWYENFDLPVERERGLGDRDAHRHVGDGFLQLRAGEWAGYAAGLDPAVTADLAA
ncbi:MAG TPA: glycogen debranching enzyme N-terminal domain-containing protein, partial [Stellaceae bacterium]|nr:glycogen debranching enzyme N-terminal domain-containing protein [Stellaceae bacterium]